ncbi:MAG: glutamate racemase [Eubacteriales bacterium]|nr:glutamate racemase [Eubacteriales bacterium]MDD4474191.1 glutamate racemase [Eubacteriales bacterium]
MKSLSDRAVGVFDSGLGGLTAASKLREFLPHENIVYFGDTARLPYGTRSRQTIVKYAKSDLAFLKSKDVKAVLVACGTVSSNAINELRETEPDLPIVGVLEASADTACEIAQAGNGKVLLIGTSATVGSGKYEEYINSKYKGITILSRACPLFVSLVENKLRCGYSVKRMVAAEYLLDLSQEKPAAVILGCTHYILLADVLHELFPDSVLVDSGEESAKRLAATLSKKDMLNKSEDIGKSEFYVSDASDEFLNKASVFVSDKIKSVGLIDIDQYS